MTHCSRLGINDPRLKLVLYLQCMIVQLYGENIPPMAVEEMTALKRCYTEEKT